MIPTLQTDTGLYKQRKKELDDGVKDDVPEFFSPRPSHSRNCSMTNFSLERSVCAAALLGSTDATERQLERRAEQGSLAMTSETILQQRECDLLPEEVLRSMVSSSVLSPIKEPEHRERPRSHSSLKATLLDHERVRNRSSSLQRVFATALFDDDNGCRTLPERCYAATDSVDMCEKLALREVYVSGKPWRCVVDAQRANISNSSLNISALATSSSGEHVALGDRSGRVLVMRRCNSQQTELQDGTYDNDVDEKEEDYREGGRCLHVCEPYEFAAGRQAYTFVIDPLNSVEVTPCIQALCFLPQVGPTTYLLTANEKMPKLYKVVKVREAPVPFLTTDSFGEKNIGSMTLDPLGCPMAKTAMKEVSRYALNHEYNINSICPVTDCAQFLSADDITVKLWCIAYPDTSIETYSLKASFDDEIRETIYRIHTFPHEPFLVFIATSSGAIRVVDTRQSLKWLNQAPLVFENTYYEGDIIFTNCLSDFALSPCGRYVAGRDAMSVCLWDIRRASLRNYDETCDVVKRWELYPHLRRDIEQIFQVNTMVQFSVRFLNNYELCTGGFMNTLYTLDILKDSSMFNDIENSVTRCTGVKAQQLPELSDTTYNTMGEPLRSVAMDDVMLSTADGVDTLFNTTVTELSYPFTSVNGDCALLASCGQAVFQLAYSNRSC